MAAATIECEPEPRGQGVGVGRSSAMTAALAVHIMSNAALTGTIYDIDGGQQLVVARTAE